jgi:polysaccharide deacetylase family sporulation protein PdaB
MIKNFFKEWGENVRPTEIKKTLKNINYKNLFSAKNLIRALLLAAAIIISWQIAFPSIQTVFLTAAATKRKIPIYAVETPENKIAISFDATWGSEKTQTILNILDQYNIKTTFFLCGYWIDKHPEQIKDLFARGHEIGNHGNTHAHHSQLSFEKNKAEMQAVHEKIKNLLGYEMTLFRPPFGEYNNTVVNAADDMGYYTVQWSVDSLDWMNKGLEHEINQVLNHKKLKNGAIILFHNDAENTPKALPIILDKLLKDYKIVPVSELIHKDNYFIDEQGTQKLISE